MTIISTINNLGHNHHSATFNPSSEPMSHFSIINDDEEFFKFA